jgi:hypothetical protein
MGGNPRLTFDGFAGMQTRQVHWNSPLSLRLTHSPPPHAHCPGISAPYARPSDGHVYRNTDTNDEQPGGAAC